MKNSHAEHQSFSGVSSLGFLTFDFFLPLIITLGKAALVPDSTKMFLGMLNFKDASNSLAFPEVK